MGKKRSSGSCVRFHPEYPLAAEVRVAKAPGQAAFGHAVGHAHLLQDLQRTAGKHDGATALRKLQLGCDHHAGHAVARKLERGDHGRGPRAGDYHFLASLGRMLRGQPWLENLVGVIERRARFRRGRMHDFLVLGLGWLPDLANRVGEV